MNPLFEKILDAEDALESARRRYLEKGGWSYSCSNPASHWMWEKKLDDGRVVMLNTEAAICWQEMQESFTKIPA